ncbi:FG-GAP-like repeat-containing protein [Granulicella sp. 5B5]|uniref:FG-GAP-like repeat-containing protein n=1 Tax=Granulicella sp. 5B5 TaxID=1617967 RepID=UPI002102EB44|nr:FG-GAP-like repeat-containing protein [Granulicella sp. 5B5]
MLFGDTTRYRPHYPSPSSLADVLRLVPPGSDSYITESYASQIAVLFALWARKLTSVSPNHEHLLALLSDHFEASSLIPAHEVVLRDRAGIHVSQRSFAPAASTTSAAFLKEITNWLDPLSAITVAEFEIYAIDVASTSPLTVQIEMRYNIAGTRHDRRREERVGGWQLLCSQTTPPAWTIHRWQALSERLSIGEPSSFIDITAHALAGNSSYTDQLQHGVDHWRTVLDGACGIDIYANNGITAGDYNNDGLDDIYVCQPAGLPNRLYRNRGDGTFEDVSAHAGVDVLDNTACALFADFDNRGLQDLLVVCGSGPLLFRNNGDGTFALKHDAFQFAAPPNGTFTHAALADYDNDGRLDIYFCTYQYYLGLDQYHYPVPYYDARNGPQNCLLHNEGNGRFVETTQAAGLNVENNRYSFACAWGDSNGNGAPDLCIANDFGKSQLYRNNGNGTFQHISQQSHVEDAAAGMSACWADFDNDGHQDIYISSMWEAAGQRVSHQKQFHPDATEEVRSTYQRQALGNALYRNLGNGTFHNGGAESNTAMAHWSWAADAWDFDHDGFSDLYVTNGYISAADLTDIGSFFWRQIVANSPDDASPRLAYEHGWNAINELVRADNSWNAYQRNVMFANNGDGTFAEVSSVVGLDCLEDSRSFALADIDHDGRLELLLKNRNAPQLRILRNNLTEIGHSVCFRLRGHKSNRDAIGTSITLQAGSLKQTKYLQAGTGFLGQHSKELFFGVGIFEGPLTATIHWPSGLAQTFEALPINQRIELEEGLATFTSKPFVAPPQLYQQPGPPAPRESLPADVDTWLITPLKAPAFSLSDTTGTTHHLQDSLGSYVLLHLFATTSPASTAQLAHLQRNHAQLHNASLQLIALSLDEPAQSDAVRSFAKQSGLAFPVLLGTPEVGGIYNIIYRYLFDRRRDLAFPTAFLLDKEGQIVKVYQGSISADRILHDVATAPTTPQQRIERALPFKGRLYQSTLQRNDFTYGVALFQHGYYEQAESSFQQVVATRPSDPEAYYNLGTLNLRRNNFDQAREYLNHALKLRSNYPEAWNNLGMMAAQQGHAEEAVQNFQQALELRPDYEIALLNLGNVYRRAGAYPQAESALKRALALQADDAEVHYSLGMLYAQQNQLQTAAGYLQQAIVLRPIYPEALNNLGIIYVRLQQFDLAEQQFKTGIERAPDNDQAYLNLARLYAMQGDKARARAALQSLLQHQPQNAVALKALDTLQ